MFPLGTSEEHFFGHCLTFLRPGLYSRPPVNPGDDAPAHAYTENFAKDLVAYWGRRLAVHRNRIGSGSNLPAHTSERARQSVQHCVVFAVCDFDAQRRLHQRAVLALSFLRLPAKHNVSDTPGLSSVPARRWTLRLKIVSPIPLPSPPSGWFP
jgi:hypothetical protein